MTNDEKRPEEDEDSQDRETVAGTPSAKAIKEHTGMQLGYCRKCLSLSVIDEEGLCVKHRKG